MDTVIKLEPCNIRHVWDEIRPGLEEILATWPDSNTWRPEDVYAKVVAGDAVLYKTDDGFAVCTLEVDEWTGDTDLFIWIAYAPSSKQGGMLKKYLPSFIEIAKHLGCKGIQTGSLHPALAHFDALKALYTTYRYTL